MDLTAIQLSETFMTKHDMGFIWPDVFTDENFSYDVNDHLDKKKSTGGWFGGLGYLHVGWVNAKIVW